jgi:hypothetical protein
MRVNEVITEQVVDEYTSEHDPGIRGALEQKGYKYLGSGVDQAAYTEPGTGLVLKIFGTNDTDQFSNDHKMFFKWYKFCTKHQDNPFLPRFYGHESFFWPHKPSKGQKPHRYLMIRTEPLQESGNVGSVLANMSVEIGDGESVKNVMRYLQETNPKTYANLVARIREKGVLRFLQTVKKLHEIGDRNGFAWDLHSGNIMMRKDGTPIINDPWVV